MTDNEWIKIIQGLVAITKRERINLTDISALGSGGWEFLQQIDKNIEARGIALLMKQIIRDGEIQTLLRTALEYRYLTSAMEMVNERIPILDRFGPAPLNQYHARKNELEAQLKELLARAKKKLELLRQLGEVLKESGYDEAVELPEINPGFPSFE